MKKPKCVISRWIHGPCAKCKRPETYNEQMHLIGSGADIEAVCSECCGCGRREHDA